MSARATGRPAPRAPTLEEVAALAGVSRATASRVLRDSANVSDQARERVHAAARRLSYAPNLAARALVTGRSDSVAFVIDETEERTFADPFLLAVLRSAHDVLADAGLQLVVTVASRPEDRDRFVGYAAGGHVDGALIVSLHGHDDLPRRLEEAGVPVVLSGRPPGAGEGLSFVDVDNLGGARLATAHLLGSGRRVVATIAGPQDMSVGQDRLAGYRAALAEAGVAADLDLVAEAAFTVADGFDAMTALLAARPDLDAVFAASDLQAMGALRALRSAGREVPDDVAVVGFDDVPLAAEQHPPLTTVRQPIADLSSTMTRLLLDRIAGRQPQPPAILPVDLVVRGSA